MKPKVKAIYTLYRHGKLTKAQELGIPVISEEQLKEMLGI